MENEALALAESPAQNTVTVLELIQRAEAMKASGREAEVPALYAEWIRRNQGSPLLYAVLFNYAVALTDAGDLDLARAQLERAIALSPAFMPPYINLGRIYERQGALDKAVQQWSLATQALASVNGGAITHKTTALNQAARVLEGANQESAAEQMLRQSLELEPTQREAMQHFLALRQRQCEWPVIAAWERISRETALKGISPLSAAAYTDDPLLHLAQAWHYNLTDVGTPAAGLLPKHPAPQAKKRLKIGYLSSDLREHAVGQLMAEVFALHDRDRVEVFAYYCGPASADPLHAQFKATADRWTDITAMSDAAAARRIAEDGIDILVDVNGYTREGRTKLVALRPAPVIVNWLGYPGTMGSPYHHYIVADEWIIPQASEIYYSEKTLRLPCYQPNNRQRQAATRTPSRAEAGLPEDAMVYCCFNGLHKLTRFTFDRWLTILARVPGSVLWLMRGEEETHTRLRQHARERGIAPERLIFAEKLRNDEHLARYPLADLFLDTTPYGAHTTASDALWMGVPVLTYSGRSFASRVCGSLVRAAGLPDLVCETAEAYVDRAVSFGKDRAGLAPYREKLQAGRGSCALFNTPLLVREMETLYGSMWADCVAGKLPQPDLANLDAYLEVGINAEHEEEETQIRPDYRAWWRERLQKRARVRPLVAPDRRAMP